MSKQPRPVEKLDCAPIPLVLRGCLGRFCRILLAVPFALSMLAAFIICLPLTLIDVVKKYQ